MPRGVSRFACYNTLNPGASQEQHIQLAIASNSCQRSNDFCLLQHINSGGIGRMRDPAWRAAELPGVFVPQSAVRHRRRCLPSLQQFMECEKLYIGSVVDTRAVVRNRDRC